MQNRSDAQLRFLLCGILLLSALAGGPRLARGADNCPTAADEIATDRPDVTNSSLVVPLESLQAENGMDWTVGHGSNVLDGTNTRLRLGVAHCTGFLIDIPNYFGSLNGSQPCACNAWVFPTSSIRMTRLSRVISPIFMIGMPWI